MRGPRGNSGCDDQMNGIFSVPVFVAAYRISTTPCGVMRTSRSKRYGMRLPVHARCTACPSAEARTSTSGCCDQSSPWSGSSSPPKPRIHVGSLHAPTVGKHSS